MQGLAVVLLTALWRVRGAVQEEGGVLVLTEATFDTAVEEHHALLVEFYAPWCGHCQALAPEYVKAAALLREQEAEVRLAKVDVTKEKKLGERFNIEGFPTLKYFQNGRPSDYEGPREAKGIVDWLDKKTGPPFLEVNSKAEIEKALEEKQAIVVGLFGDEEETKVHKAASVFKEVAAAVGDIDFYVVTKPNIVTEFHQPDGAILLLKTFDDKEVKFAEKMTKENVERFIEENSRPLVTEFSQENANKIFDSDITTHFLVFSGKADAEYRARIEMVKQVAKAHKGKISFVHMNTGDEENDGILEFFGLTKERCPTFAIFEMESSSKYLPVADKAKEITVANIGDFVADYFAGKLQKFLKSAPLPEDWNSGPVNTLVTSNFGQIAFDKTKDVFIEFYAPWCGHCKALAPVWEELGEKYKDKTDLVIAKVDSTQNEIEDVDIDGFPTIKMFKKDTNEVVDYVGKRDLENLVKFIETGEQEEAEEEEDEDYEFDDEFDGEEEMEEEDGLGEEGGADTESPHDEL